MTTDTPPPAKALDLPRYHVWLAEEDQDHRYVGVVTVRNVDQLTAEKQAKPLRIDVQTEGFHLTNLWIWAACIRLEETTLKFKPFTEALEWSKVKDDEDQEAEEGVDPTTTGQGVSTG
jgi:hypothetical protein